MAPERGKGQMEVLKPYRRRIDALDDKIVGLLAERTSVIREVGPLKYEHGIDPILPDRIEEVRERAAALAGEKGLDPDLVRRLYQILIDYSCALEEEIIRDLSSRPGKTAVR